MLTHEISEYVSDVIGVELTPDLYEVAKEFNSGVNILFINADVLSADVIEKDRKFKKVFMYEVIQHFDYQDVDALFEKLMGITMNNSLIFIGGILDVEKKWSFFDTPERREAYFNELLSGNNTLGTWYHKDFLNSLAKKHGFDVECVEQDRELYTSHYRFDCVLRRK